MASLPDIRFDLAALLTIFDELLPITNEDRKDYWLRKNRSDGITVTLNFSACENQAGIVVTNDAAVCPAAIALRLCREIRVLENHCLEILSGKDADIRCFISLVGPNILDVDV
jgi:hypothetical protein